MASTRFVSALGPYHMAKRSSVAHRLRRVMLAAAVCLAMLAPSGLAHGASVTFFSDPSDAQVIPDNGFNGDLATSNVASSTITIEPFAQDLIDHLSITIAITHERIGDLTILLEAPDGSLLTLLDRPGYWPSEPGVVGGSTARFDAEFPITFDDDAQTWAFMMGWLPDGTTVGENTTDRFMPHDTIFGRGLNDVVGMSLAGQWTLHVGDAAPFDSGFLESPPPGTLSGWEISAVSVPSPGAAGVGLMLMGALVGTRLLRRPRDRSVA